MPPTPAPWPWPWPTVAAALRLRELGAWRLWDGVRRWSHGTIGYGAPVVWGGRLYVAGSTVAGDQPVTVVEQFALS